MQSDRVRDAYANRVQEYAELLGTMDAVHDADRRLIIDWALQLRGDVLDAGCGPGHWVAELARQGVSISGLDQVDEFISLARRRYPEESFAAGRFQELPLMDESLSGVLAWYSLIHLPPHVVPLVLGEFARVLHSDGRLLLGLFNGPSGETFDHAVAPAYWWSAEAMKTELQKSGFVVDSVHEREDVSARPHLAVEARRASPPLA